MYYELRKQGLHVERQQIIPIIWDKLKIDIRFRADLIVEECVIIELKSVKEMNRFRCC